MWIDCACFYIIGLLLTISSVLSLYLFFFSSSLSVSFTWHHSILYSGTSSSQRCFLYTGEFSVRGLWILLLWTSFCISWWADLLSIIWLPVISCISQVGTNNWWSVLHFSSVITFCMCHLGRIYIKMTFFSVCCTSFGGLLYFFRWIQPHVLDFICCFYAWWCTVYFMICMILGYLLVYYRLGGVM